MNETERPPEDGAAARTDAGATAVGAAKTWVENFRRRRPRREPASGRFARVSVAEAARRMGVCEGTVRNMAKSGKIKWSWGNGNIRPNGIIWQSVVDYIDGRNAQKARGL